MSDREGETENNRPPVEEIWQQVGKIAVSYPLLEGK